MADMVAAELIEVLSGAPVFSSMSAETIERIARQAREVVLRARERLWQQGTRATSLGVVLAGRLAVTRGTSRREVIIDVVGPGDVLGDAAFTLRATHLYDVRCLRRARVALVPAATLRAVLEDQPALSVALALDLGQQVLRLTRRLEALAAGSVPQRLAKVLLSLVERHGEPFPGGVLVPVRLRREDLAALAATTLESASRHLSAWGKRGVLVQQPAGFLLRDPGPLRDLAGE